MRSRILKKETFFATRLKPCIVNASESIAFKTIDWRIEPNELSKQSILMQNVLMLPEEYEQEIRDKLMQHPNIVSVDNVLTEYGLELFGSLKVRFFPE